MGESENRFRVFTDSELESEFNTSKKLFYPAFVFLFLDFAWGVYAASKAKMGFFLIILFLFVAVTCLKYIDKHGKLKKEMKLRNLLSK